jgi:predicted Ser/Thr protein kinase
MSDKDRHSASDFVTQLVDALDLKPQTLEPMTVGQFLIELKDHPDRASTAHSLLVRAVDALGEVDIDNEPPQRQPRLRMLKELGYKLYKAFDLVRGSQRTVHEQMEHLRAAESGGYQLFLAMIIKGPPGSGKSMLVEKYKEALEGHIVYSIAGCPVHENPINLLTLLTPAARKKLAEKLGLTEKEAKKNKHPSLKDMLLVAGKPCKHCWNAVMEAKDANDPEKSTNPNEALLRLKVIPQRLSARRFGISTKTPTGSIASTIVRGNRGLVDMGELFDGTSSPVKGGGVSPALLPLLDATNDRKLLGANSQVPQVPKAGTPGGDCDIGPGSAGTDEVPVDAVLIGQTNEGAYKQFISALDKDAGKVTRRIHVFTFPYNTSVTEEELAYKDQIERLREVPHLDPMALKLLALLAVVSRLDKTNDVDVVKRARIYDGEKLQVKRSGNAPGVNDAKVGQTADHPEYWTAKDLWAQAGEAEAINGLDMTVMFNLLSEIIERSLHEKRFEKCVSSYELLTFLRERVAEMEKSDGFTEAQKEVLKRCRTQFLVSARKGDKPGELESEYQRLLVRQVYEIAAPDFERRAEETFVRYNRHANAWAIGNDLVIEPDDAGGRPREVGVDLTFLNKVENQMDLLTITAKENHRRGLEGEIMKHTRELRERFKLCQEGDCEDIDINWRTLPKLADGIRRMLNGETRARLETLLKKPIELPNESEEDKLLRERLNTKFAELGYCPHCLSQALEYFKINELWTLQS